MESLGLAKQYNRKYPEAPPPHWIKGRAEPSPHYVQWKSNKLFLDKVEGEAFTFLPELAKEYNRIKAKSGVREACTVLAEFREHAPRLQVVGGQKFCWHRKDLQLNADNDNLNEFCAVKARHCRRLMTLLPSEEITISLLNLLETYGIELTPKEAKKIRTESFQLRLTSEKWWRRKIKPLCFRASEQIWREMGHTRRGKGVYVSDYTLRRFLDREHRNRNLLENLEATNDKGDVLSLAELSDLNTSNPELRRNELMVRMRGFEEYAEQDATDWQAIFYTVTCPSKYHIYSDGRKNGNYNGATPRDGQQYLSSMWARVRAKARRSACRFFGFRIAEPHHDGCPHWHLLLFVEKEGCQRFSDIFKAEALRVDGRERGANKYRFESCEIKAERGTPAGYIAKYVSKNIDGFGVGDDWEAQDTATITAVRVRAWAACWGIRQFQQIGGPSVQVYREFRRLANHPEQIPVEGKLSGTPEQLQLMLFACDNGDWCEYTKQMGGAVLPRIERPVSLFYQLSRRLNQYAENVREIVGLSTCWFFFPLKSRVHKWIIDFIPQKRAAKNAAYPQ